MESFPLQGEFTYSSHYEPSPSLSVIRDKMNVHTRNDGWLLAWNALSVVAVAWMVLNFWKFILITMAVGAVGFILVTAILSPVLTFAMKITGFVKNNLRFVVLVSWRGVSARYVELSHKVKADVDRVLFDSPVLVYRVLVSERKWYILHHDL